MVQPKYGSFILLLLSGALFIGVPWFSLGILGPDWASLYTHPVESPFHGCRIGRRLEFYEHAPSAQASGLVCMEFHTIWAYHRALLPYQLGNILLDRKTAQIEQTETISICGTGLGRPIRCTGWISHLWVCIRMPRRSVPLAPGMSLWNISGHGLEKLSPEEKPEFKASGYSRKGPIPRERLLEIPI